MASTDGWLKEQMLGMRRQPGGDAGWGTVQVAQAGDARAEKYLRNVGVGANSMGAPSVVPPPQSVSDLVPAPASMEAVGASPIDRRGPDFGVPPANPGKRSMATDAIQLAAAPTGELQAADPAAMEAFMKKMGVKGGPAMAPAPAAAPAPTPGAPDPLKLKENLKNRMKGAGLEGPVYAAARGGLFDEGDEVLVGEQGPEVVKFGEPGAVIPAAAAAGVLGMDKKKVDAVSKAARAAGGKAVDMTKQGLRTGADWVKTNLGSAGAAGRTAGQAVNAAQAGAEALPELLDEFKEGYRGTRGTNARPTGVNPNVGADAKAFQASRGTFPGGQPLPGTPGATAGNLTKMGELRLHGGQAARVAGKALPGVAAVAAGAEAADMTGAVGRGEFGALDTPQSRIARGMRILSGGLIKPAGSGPGAQPPAPPAQPPADQSGSMGVEDGNAAVEAAQRQGALDFNKLQVQINANREIASPEAGGTGISVGGLRYGPANAGAHSAGFNRRVRQGDEALDIAGERNRIAAAQARATLLQNQRKLNLDTEESGAKRREAEILSWAEQATPASGGGGLFSKGVTADQRKEQVTRTAAEFRNEITASLGDRKDGRKIGELSDTEMQQLVLAKKLKDRTIAGRAGFSQSLRDYFGSKRFDSNNLYSFVPASVERASLPGSYVVKMKNGNTAEVQALANGQFNWLGPNEPVDADTMQMIAPLIKKFEQGRKK